MTDLRALLAPIRERLAAATPGPWHWDEDHWLEGVSGGYVLSNDVVLDKNRVEPVSVAPDNAILIANAPTDLTRLLAAIEAVTALADAWQARGEHLRKSAESAPEDVQEALDDQGGDMIWHAGLISAALAAALGSDTTNQEGTQ